MDLGEEKGMSKCRKLGRGVAVVGAAISKSGMFKDRDQHFQDKFCSI